MAPLQFGLSWRLALRHFSKSPGSYLYGAVTLALGLGSATLLFSLMQAFTQPLPVPDGEDVLRVVVVDPIKQDDQFTVDDLRAWRTHAQSFESIAAVSVGERRVGTDRGDLYASVAHVTAETLPLLRVEPLFGRWPTIGDGPTIAIGEDRWATTFEGDPDVLGKPVRLGSEVATVVGVMPSDFRFPYKQTIWQVVPPDSPRLANGEVVARLKPGVSRAAANAEFTELLQAARLDRDGVRATATARLVGYTEERGEGEESVVAGAMLLVVVGLVLLSCSNVSALLLERNAARMRTLALHRALGARPGQITLQILVEALLVGGLGAILGAAVAHAGLRFLMPRVADNLNFYWTRLELDVASGAFAAALGFVVALVCGGLPARRARKVQVAEVLSVDAGAVRNVQRSTLSWILVNAQTAFAVAVAVAAVGMASIIVDKPWAVNLLDAFSEEQVVAAVFAFEGKEGADHAARMASLERLERRARTEPGVLAAAVTEGDLLGHQARRSTWRRVALDEQPFGDDRGVPVLHVTPGFRDTFRIGLIDGRGFDSEDMWDASPTGVALVTERFVSERLSGQAPLDRRIRLDLGGGREQKHRIVGVVSNLAVTENHRRHPAEHVLLPIAATEARNFQLTARTGGLAGIEARILEITRDTDPTIALMAFSFDDLVRQFNVYLGAIPETLGILAMFGGVGCAVVVAIGIYGLVAFEMRQRLGEYAVRLALGARVDQLLRLVVRRVCLLIVPGALIGLVLAWAGSPLLGVFTSQEIDVVPILLIVTAFYAVIVVIAAGVPALRILRANPARVLNG